MPSRNHPGRRVVPDHVFPHHRRTFDAAGTADAVEAVDMPADERVPVLPATLMSHRVDPEREPLRRHVVVDDPGEGPVNVRWRLNDPAHWTCRVHGPMSTADCEHTFAAGLLLAERLLGLTRLPQFRAHPKEETP